ncbi:IS605 OrfB family transposase, partial [Salinibacter ruber]|nr:IS605 OrfB family transposase [Salinibacter ruber]
MNNNCRDVSTVVIGELKGIRDSVDYGSRMNQRLHQWAH